MEEKSVKPQNPTTQPVAKARPVRVASAHSVNSNTNAAPATQNLFTQAYINQKKENIAEEKAKSTEESAAPITVTADGSDDKKSNFKIIFIVLIIISVILLIASGVYLALGFFSNNKASVNTIPVENAVYESAKLTSPFSYQKIYPVDFPEGIKEEYKDLYAQNQDFSGWVSIPGTNVDMPVYRTNNNDYYLKHDNYGAYTRYGATFMDYYCNCVSLTKNTVIYAHNFDDDMLFCDIQKYEDLEFYKEHPIVEYSTPYKTYKWKVIAAIRTNGNSADDNDYLFYYVAADMNNDSFMEFIDELNQRSYIHTGVDVRPDDKLLTLSTCTYFFDRNGSIENARFALFARMVRDDESEDVDVSKATKNENVRYPQLYYDVFGGTNPYKNASKWQPKQ